MSLIRIILILGLFAGVIGIVMRIAPGKSKMMLTRDEIHFPVVSGSNLDRQELTFPKDFAGQYNLVMVAFQQYQQQSINTWIPHAQEIEASIPGFVYYELPTINEMPMLSRTFINEGMRAGIPDQTARERTVTLYLNKDGFKTALGIPGEGDIYLFLVDRDGNIYWQTKGEYTPDKLAEIQQVLQELKLENPSKLD